MRKDFLQESELFITEFEKANADFLSIGERLIQVLKIQHDSDCIPEKISFLKNIALLAKEKKEDILFVEKQYNELHILQTQVIERILQIFSSVESTRKEGFSQITKKIAGVACGLTKSKKCVNLQYSGELPGAYSMSQNKIPIKKEPEASIITELLYRIAMGEISTQTQGNRFYLEKIGASPDQKKKNRTKHVTKIFRDETRIWFYAGYIKYAGIEIPIKGQYEPLIDIATLEKIIQNILPKGEKIRNMMYIQQVKKQALHQDKNRQDENIQQPNDQQFGEQEKNEQDHDSIPMSDMGQNIFKVNVIGSTDHPAKFGKNTIRPEPQEDDFPIDVQSKRKLQQHLGIADEELGEETYEELLGFIDFSEDRMNEMYEVNRVNTFLKKIIDERKENKVGGGCWFDRFLSLTQEKVLHEIAQRDKQKDIIDDYNQEMKKLKKYFKKEAKKITPRDIDVFLNHCEDLLHFMDKARRSLICDEIQRLLLNKKFQLDPKHPNFGDKYIAFLHQLKDLCDGGTSPRQEILKIEKKIQQGITRLEGLIQSDRLEGQKLIDLGPIKLKNAMKKYNEILRLITDLYIELHKKEKIFLDQSKKEKIDQSEDFATKNSELKDSLMRQKEFIDAQKKIYEDKLKSMKDTYEYLIRIVNTPRPGNNKF